jgi:hypothetical protein
MLNEPDSEVSIVIPKGSALGRSVSNFHLLKREADSAGRIIVVESVDETILAFAKESGIESSHPLWKGVRGTGGFSDIVPRHETAIVEDEDLEEERSARKIPGIANKRSKHIEPVSARDESADEEEVFEEEEEEEEEKREEREEPQSRMQALKSRFFDAQSDTDDDDNSEARGFPGKLVGAIVGGVVVIGIALYIVSVFFDHADITINFKQTPWSYQNNFTADKAAVGIDPSNNVLPAQIFTASKNVTQVYPGSVVQNVSQKAQGSIIIYNAYSSAPQTLVATTRFMAPDGKIFRLVNNTTVPGEQTSGGKLVPSSITAAIIADQAGPEYNVSPIAKLTIPGFQSDPARYTGFYGTITTALTGGFTGQRATPTAADIINAKASTTALLQAALQGGFSGNYPNNFKILDGATLTQISKITVNTSTDPNGNFTVFGEATLQAIGFDEQAFKNYLLSLAQVQEASSTFKSLTLNYSNVTASFAKGQISFAISAQASLEPAFSVDQFASKIQGKGISDARSTIAALPNLSDGEISVWPSWLWSIPSKASKIHITVN